MQLHSDFRIPNLINLTINGSLATLLTNYNSRLNYLYLSPSQIIVIQIYYLSFLKAELRLAGRWR